MNIFQRSAVPVLACLFAAGNSAQEVLSLQPESVEVGEPFQLILELENSTAIEPGAPDLDDTWVLLEESRVSGPTGVRFVWSIASLDPGSRLISFTPSEELAIAPEPQRVEIVGVLGVDEVEPRPLPGLPSDFGTALSKPVSRSPWLYLAAGFIGALLLCALGLILWRRRQRATRTLPAPTLLERFDDRADMEMTARHHHWAQLLREAVDRRTGQSRVALTEDEWLGSLSAEGKLTPELQAGVQAALGHCERVRFAGQRPSPYAAEELQKQVRSLLVEIGAEPQGSSRADRAAQGGRKAGSGDGGQAA